MRVSAFLADFDDDSGVGDDDDGQRDEVEEGDAEHGVHHLPAVVVLEKPEGDALVEIWVVRVRLDVEYHTL